MASWRYVCCVKHIKQGSRTRVCCILSRAGDTGSLLRAAFQTAALWCSKWAREPPSAQGGGNSKGRSPTTGTSPGAQSQTAAASKITPTAPKSTANPKTATATADLNPPLFWEPVRVEPNLEGKKRSKGWAFYCLIFGFIISFKWRALRSFQNWSKSCVIHPFAVQTLWAPRVEFAKKYAEEPVAPDKLINKTSNGWNSEFDYSSNLLLPLHCDLFQKPCIVSFSLSKVATL